MKRRCGGREGMALVVVMCMMMLVAMALAILSTLASGAALRSRDLVRNEQAFYVAEGAAEVAVQHIAGGGAVPATLTGSLGAGTYSVDIEAGTPENGYPTYRVRSTGMVGKLTRRIHITGVKQASWAKYALWYNSESVQLWIVGGEEFNGPVHANTNLWFHSYNVASLGQAHFFDSVSSTKSNITRYDGTVNPTFDEGIVLNAKTQSTQSVNFEMLATNADLVVTGKTYITLSGTNMLISNAGRGWTNQAVGITSNISVYVEGGTTWSYYGYPPSWHSVASPGDVYVGGPNGMSGRLTIISEGNINITNHLRYVNNPETNAASKDTLGLVAKTNIVVATSAPDDLEVYAHLIATVGGFGVASYSSTSLGDRGDLKVYGGIVNQVRQPVGTTGGTGYRKKYVYDPRFRTESPPGYPVLAATYEWHGWEEE